MWPRNLQEFRQRLEANRLTWLTAALLVAFVTSATAIRLNGRLSADANLDPLDALFLAFPVLAVATALSMGIELCRPWLGSREDGICRTTHALLSVPTLLLVANAVVSIVPGASGLGVRATAEEAFRVVAIVLVPQFVGILAGSLIVVFRRGAKRDRWVVAAPALAVPLIVFWQNPDTYYVPFLLTITLMLAMAYFRLYLPAPRPVWPGPDVGFQDGTPTFRQAHP
ncbi:MAG: hypothetical protein HYT80_02935 [Euryarchaeota archaeon]|nr:hypothetical protein [Euryarchaeota archaeon]